jgi:hypothetical protein
MSKKSVKPEDVLPDGVDTANIGGKQVRKGTIAAFLANVDIFEDAHASEEQKQEAFAAMKGLAPGVITIGLHRHVKFKNPQIEKILQETV